MVAIPAPLHLVPGGVDDTSAVKHKSDVLLAVALQRPLKDLPYHLSRFRLYNEVVFIFGIFLVAVDGKSADVLALPPLHVKDHADVLRQILQVPLVDETVDLPGLLVALDLSVSIVGYRNEANAPHGKQTVDVLLHQFHVTGETGLALAENNLELFLLGRLDHSIKVRPQAVGAGVVLIAVDMVDIPAALHGVVDQQRLLILDALGFGLLLIFVLLTQSCINRAKDSYTSFKA